MTDLLYGTVTSPYVRRVRAAALELGFQLSLVDTMTAAGQAELRGVAPLWKVPVARLGGQLLFDSRVIQRWLSQRSGAQPLGPWLEGDWATQNAVSVLDGAVDALINAFYLQREGVDPSLPYWVKQQGRARASLEWLERQAESLGLTNPERFDWLALQVVTAVDWMSFRQVFPIDQLPSLSACAQVHAQRPSLAATAPQDPTQAPAGG